MERRLAAIMSADVVGYSRLIEADEAGTLATMKAHRQELWTPKIEALLAEAGSDKSKLVTAAVYLSDMALKSEMNDVWVAWADCDNPCTSVCVGVTFEPRAYPAEALMVEIAVNAAID